MGDVMEERDELFAVESASRSNRKKETIMGFQFTSTDTWSGGNSDWWGPVRMLR